MVGIKGVVGSRDGRGLGVGGDLRGGGGQGVAGSQGAVGSRGWWGQGVGVKRGKDVVGVYI